MYWSYVEDNKLLEHQLIKYKLQEEATVKSEKCYDYITEFFHSNVTHKKEI